MAENKFRLIVRKYNGEEFKVESAKCHPAKSIAGSQIHSPSVKSVCVAGISGTVYFYINEENPSANVTNVPSEIAELIENLILNNGLSKSQFAILFSK